MERQPRRWVPENCQIKSLVDFLPEGDRRTLECVICRVTMGLQVKTESEVVGRSRLEGSGEGAESEPGGVTSVLLGGVKERASRQAEPSEGSERVLKKSRIPGHWEGVIKEGRLA